MFKNESSFLLRLVKVIIFPSQTNSLIVPLAYLMAKAHGLEEFEKTLEESIRNMEGVDVDKILS